MNKKGFTLIEFLLTLLIILVVTVIALPIILYVIKNARLSAFKTSAYNVIDSAEYHLTKTDYLEVPPEGFDIEELELEIKNNKFDSGLIKKEDEHRLRLVYLTQGNYCAIGPKKNLKVSDSGCGKLDETPPNQVYIYLKDSKEDSIEITVGVDEIDSKITTYEYSIDHSKYISSNKNEYTFTNLKNGMHTIKVRVTNEAGLKKESEEYSFETEVVRNIYCVEQDKKEGLKKEVNLTCTYPDGDYTYEYSTDNKNFEKLELKNHKYTFHFEENTILYTRIVEKDKVITKTAFNINNIERNLKGAYPDLLPNMIPVIYDETKNTWIKADSRKVYFDYENKNWANAVFVRKNAITDDPKSNSREYYLSNEAIGEEIYEKDILGYYVWIPRYRYHLFNVSNKKQEATSIAIEFEDKNIIKSTGKVEGTYTNDEWYTHPAFSINDKEINGFWVSKFQNSAGKHSSCYLMKEVNNCNIPGLALYSLPYSDSITNVSISNAHLMAKKMTEKNNMYGMKEANSHVITNLEWGAIAYLTQSNYGINRNLEYQNKDYKNNLTNSTTGNITGVFDMSGTLSEMVMANYNKDAGKNNEEHSGFKNYGSVDWPENIDYYKGITSKNRLLGDATGETENWYQSYHTFINGEYPFMIRGGVMENISSIYNFTNSTGIYQPNITFRTTIYQSP